MHWATVRRLRPSLSWVQLSLLAGGCIAITVHLWTVRGLHARVIRDLLLYVIGPLGLGMVYGNRIGWRIDRMAIRNAVLLSAFVLPFYVIGSTLPSIRTFYPMWGTSSGLRTFLPHAFMQFLLAVAAESYYRGLLCVGVRDLGRKAALISPIVYALRHLGKPPIELMLSGPTDVLFGLVDYESNSILPSVIAHGLGLALLDWLVLHDPILPPAVVLRWLSWLPVPL